MSYLTEMIGLATHNFFSAATGIAVAIAFVRGLSRHSAKTLGTFWVDFTRAMVYVLLPLSVAGALFLCSQGVIQNFSPYTKAATVEAAPQTIPQGPIASQEAIKMLGTNGGGFTNANFAHPYENPTPLSNFAQMVFIFLIPAGLTYTFGKMVKDTRQGWAIFAAVLVLFIFGGRATYPAEMAGYLN
jgi:potassium-transporting ATPase potassium-binding subunit